MPVYAGKTGLVKVASATVAGISNWTLNYKSGTEETTDFESSGAEEHLSTVTGWSGSFEGKKKGAPLAIGGVAVALELQETSTSTQKWTGNAIITDIEAVTNVKGVVTYKYSFVGTGALVVPTT